MVIGHFSEKVHRLRKRLKPYMKPEGGLKEGVPPDIKKLFEEYKKQVMAEAWLD